MSFFYGFLLLSGFLLHIYIMRGRSGRAKILHFCFSALLWASFVPIIFSWQKETPRKEIIKETGLVLLDKSASMPVDSAIEKMLEKLSEESELLVCRFSNGLTAPYGSSLEKQETNLNKSLEECTAIIDEYLPEWIWVISDGGFQKQPILPKSFDALKKYVSQVKSSITIEDKGLKDLKTDPVWYTRTETNLSAVIYRNTANKEDFIDILMLIDGDIKKTQRVHLKKGESEKEVFFTSKALYIGSVFLEIRIAEGQGGVIGQNDHLLNKVHVLRDKLRILRVVGRPSWSSKFLRDYLMSREDIDLIDFHILRSMTDRVLASQKDLALIPFPVQELFVENIESFDLIIWQNFNAKTYPFFKRLYLHNIKKFVLKGGGLLLWSGKLPWDFSKSVFKEIAPVLNKGTSYISKKSNIINTKGQQFFNQDLRDLVSALPEMKLDIFTGSLQKNSQSILDFNNHSLLALRKCKKGRVVQVNSDTLWRLAYGEANQKKAYHELVKNSIMWLQKHPSLNLNNFKLKGEYSVFEKASFEFEENLSRPEALFIKKDGRVAIKQVLKAGFKQFSVKLPATPGVYSVEMKGKESTLIGISYNKNEFQQQSQRAKNIQNLSKLGFKNLKLYKEFPTIKKINEQYKTMKTGEPYYISWVYLLCVIGLMFGHWVILSRSPVHVR